jgi:hypothetical protein
VTVTGKKGTELGNFGLFPSVTLIEDGLVTNGLISVVKILISEPFCTFPI